MYLFGPILTKYWIGMFAVCLAAAPEMNCSHHRIVCYYVFEHIKHFCGRILKIDLLLVCHICWATYRQVSWNWTTYSAIHRLECLSVTRAIQRWETTVYLTDRRLELRSQTMQRQRLKATRSLTISLVDCVWQVALIQY